MKFLFTFFTVALSFLSYTQKETPKLVVGIVIDQMRYDYLYRFYDKFCEGGFKKLMNEGSNCKNTMYNYVPTYTAPGHASIYTGTTPSNHGIVGNDWYDRNLERTINCVEDNTVQTLGSSSEEGRCSPKNLKVNTITDQLRLTYKDSKVISMSIKNRGAILPGGHLSNGSYWFDYSSGNFITSSYFTQEMPSWVTAFNGEKQAEIFSKQKWETLLPLSDYYESREDNSPYEYTFGNKTAPVFPYDLKEMNKNGLSYSNFVYTPFSNTFLTNFALAAIENEKLGEDKTADFLNISYSTPDIIGHAFGPYSVEIQDCYMRLDLEIKRLIKELEEKVGKDNFVLFLTADHAVAPVPQYLVDLKLSGGYFYEDAFNLFLDSLSTKKFGQNLVLGEVNNNIYLNREKIQALNLTEEEVNQYLAEKIRKYEGIKQVYTSNELMKSGKSDNMLEMVANGYHYKESGDIVYVLEANYLPKSSKESSTKGTSHGSPYGYDTHVPLLWYGKSIKAQSIYSRTEIIDISATLVYIMNLQKTNGMTGEPILPVLH
ncbi:MAG: alkaline phosphatase PafA [Lishizhenia sp.]